jgi:hypothetical protein
MDFTQIPKRETARDLGVADFRPSYIDVVYELPDHSTPSIHTLGRVPTGFTVISTDNKGGAAPVIPEATAEDKNKWTATRIYTRSVAVSGTAKLEVR